MKLNLCSGGNVFDNWTNVDRTDVEDEYLRHLRNLSDEQVASWPEYQRRVVVGLRNKTLHFFQWDVRKGLPMYGDGSIEACYLGQCAEHFHAIQELPRLLAEVYRVLAPGGVVRITTPDMAKILSLYRNGRMGEIASEQPAFFADVSPEAQLSYLLFGASGPTCTQERYDGHFHCWTVDDLSKQLLAAGFARAWDAGAAKSAPFAECIDFGLSHSMALEAVKP